VSDTYLPEVSSTHQLNLKMSKPKETKPTLVAVTLTLQEDLVMMLKKASMAADRSLSSTVRLALKEHFAKSK
jgi:hypothetical protein